MEYYFHIVLVLNPKLLFYNYMILDKMNKNNAIFIDDAIEHLETVADRRVDCYFADWGYGENKDYNVLSQSDWAKYL